MIKNDNGAWIEDNNQIKSMFIDIYQMLFTTNLEVSEWTQTATTFPTITRYKLSVLQNDLRDYDIKEALFGMYAWKDPDPDGFPTGFYQKSWLVVCDFVCNYIKQIRKNLETIEEVNMTDLMLIPKMNNPTYVSQFRLILLCNTVCKIYSKTIVNRLKIYIDDIISAFQTSFISGRNIQENIIVAQEMMHTMNHMKGKTRAFVIKVDLNKAYDNLNWQFMEKILNEVGIPNQIKRAIINAISTVKMKVLWNGNDYNLFEIRKGLRQGDPISPYIIVLCLDTLSHMINAVVGNGNWIGLAMRMTSCYLEKQLIDIWCV